MPQDGEIEPGASTADRPAPRSLRKSTGNAPLAAARSRRAVRVVSPSSGVQAGAAIARARTRARGQRVSIRGGGPGTGPGSGTKGTARHAGGTQGCDRGGTAAGVSQSDDDVGGVSTATGGPVQDFSSHMAGIPRLGSIVETRWWISCRNDIPSDTGDSESADDENDGTFALHARASNARKRPLKRTKKNGRHEEEGWWPGIVTGLQLESDLSVSGTIKYTIQAYNHGILPGAGPSEFTGKASRVMFEARKQGDASPREVHHYADGKDDVTRITPWRYLGAPADGWDRSTSHGRAGVGAYGLQDSTTPAGEARAPSRALQHSLSAVAVVSPPAAVKALQKFGMRRLISTLQSCSKPPPHICNAFKGALSAARVVQGKCLRIGGAFQVTQSEFAELAAWFRREGPGGRRLRVSFDPPCESHFGHPSPRESFRVSFHDYGDFCDACAVPFKLRSVFIWDKVMAKEEEPACCVVGSVRTWESVFVGPMPKGTVRMSADVRVILLGHSWERIVSYNPVNESDDVGIPLLRQRDVTYDMEDGDSQHPFTAEIGASGVRIVEEARKPLRTEGVESEGSFDMVWTAIPSEGLQWAPRDAPGTVLFRIPVVCVRSAALVNSARMLLDDESEFLDDEESDSARQLRLQQAIERRYAVMSHPGPAVPQHTMEK